MKKTERKKLAGTVHGELKALGLLPSVNGNWIEFHPKTSSSLLFKACLCSNELKSLL